MDVISVAIQKGLEARKKKQVLNVQTEEVQARIVRSSSRWKAIQVLPDELQEVGLKKGEFSETLVAKMSKEPQPPLRGVFGKEHFGDPADIEDPMEEDIDVREEIQAPENSNVDEEFGMHDIVE